MSGDILKPRDRLTRRQKAFLGLMALLTIIGGVAANGVSLRTAKWWEGATGWEFEMRPTQEPGYRINFTDWNTVEGFPCNINGRAWTSWSARGKSTGVSISPQGIDFGLREDAFGTSTPC